MAKRRQETATQAAVVPEPGSSVENPGADEGVVVHVARDLGRLLAEAQNHAESLMGQRAAVVKQLESIRQTATSLLSSLGQTATEQVRKIRGGRRKKFVPPDANPAGALKPEKRATSEKRAQKSGVATAGRAAGSGTQKPRWASPKVAKKG